MFPQDSDESVYENFRNINKSLEIKTTKLHLRILNNDFDQMNYYLELLKRYHNCNENDKCKINALIEENTRNHVNNMIKNEKILHEQ